MRIAIDYTAAARQGAGIGRYARELIHAILNAQSAARLGDLANLSQGTPSMTANSGGHDYILLAGVAGLGERWRAEKARLQGSAAYPDHLAFRELPITDDWMARIWQRLRLPLPAEVFTGGVDIFYSPDFVLPPLHSRTKAILTVHDLSFLRHPETFTPALRAYLETAVPRSIARADLILADSDATRLDIIDLLAVPERKVVTLYSGVVPRFTPGAEPDERARLQNKYHIGERPYILSLGTVQPRKNYIRLMEACDPLTGTHDLDLVIVGRPAWMAEPILEAAAQRPYVRMMGFLDDADLPALYRQAATFAFPSLYEGFGLPPLEAMACGTPVVASSVSSVPEVVGNAGLQVNPSDTSAWTEALARVLDDAGLRAYLRRAGLTRARQFTWTRAAQQWLSVVELLEVKN
ncbi:MAG: glycosyltransferase family 4 protein [Anaerolineae bacterium]|nr:glycosyltransferase family 4 protein [Anaerolineae bacterium]